MKQVTIAVLLSGFAVLPAVAGNVVFEAPAEPELATPAPIPAPVSYGTDWTGSYAGIQLGYGQADVGGTDGDGIIGGIHAGYNYDFGSLVAGAELNYDLAEIDLDGGAGSIDNVGRLKLRLGYDLGSALVYATAGMASADANVGGDLSDTGLLYGIGFDYLVANNWTAGAELLRHEFDDFDGSGSDVEVDTLQARLSYKF